MKIEAQIWGSLSTNFGNFQGQRVLGGIKYAKTITHWRRPMFAELNRRVGRPWHTRSPQQYPSNQNFLLLQIGAWPYYASGSQIYYSNIRLVHTDCDYDIWISSRAAWIRPRLQVTNFNHERNKYLHADEPFRNCKYDYSASFHYAISPSMPAQSFIQTSGWNPYFIFWL